MSSRASAGGEPADDGTLDHPSRAAAFRLGLRDAAPIAVSFFFLFVAIGIASDAAGLSPLEGTLLTLATFAAPAQFAALDLVVRGRTWLEIGLLTLAVNFRFFVMGAAIAPYFRGVAPWRVLLAAPMLSASTFAIPFLKLRTTPRGSLDPFGYYLGVCAAGYPISVLATPLGFLLVRGLPAWLDETLTLIFPVYFTTLVAREWPRSGPLAAALGGFVLTPLADALLPAFGGLVAVAGVALVLAALERRA